MRRTVRYNHQGVRDLTPTEDGRRTGLPRVVWGLVSRCEYHRHNLVEQLGRCACVYGFVTLRDPERYDDEEAA